MHSIMRTKPECQRLKGDEKENTGFILLCN